MSRHTYAAPTCRPIRHSWLHGTKSHESITWFQLVSHSRRLPPPTQQAIYKGHSRSLLHLHPWTVYEYSKSVVYKVNTLSENDATQFRLRTHSERYHSVGLQAFVWRMYTSSPPLKQALIEYCSSWRAKWNLPEENGRTAHRLDPTV